MEGMLLEDENAARSAARPEYWYYDHLAFPLPERHRYPRRKYRLVRDLLLGEGTLRPEQLHPCEPVEWETLALLHEEGYLADLRNGALSPEAEREIGLPVTPLLVERARAAVGGTLDAAERALALGATGTLGGGNHHAFPGRGSGYCVLNDIAVSIRSLQQRNLAERIAIVDLDVHQGNANAEIFRRDPGVFTLSAHGARNWPHRKAESDLDIALPDDTGDDAYLEAIEPALLRLFEQTRPDLVYYQAGADPLACDRLGRLALSLEGLRRRDRLVLSLCLDHHCPVVVTMGGGYGRPIEETVEAHANTFRELEALWRAR